MAKLDEQRSEPAADERPPKYTWNLGGLTIADIDFVKTERAGLPTDRAERLARLVARVVRNQSKKDND